jgi:hypothetical protein
LVCVRGPDGRLVELAVSDGAAAPLETSGGGTWRSGDVTGYATGYATKLVLAGAVTATQIAWHTSLPQSWSEANPHTMARRNFLLRAPQ